MPVSARADVGIGPYDVNGEKMKVVLASKNEHKLVEISKITEQFGFQLVLQSELGVDIDVEETGTTFEENSFL